jgi:hypothetical protein
MEAEGKILGNKDWVRKLMEQREKGREARHLEEQSAEERKMQLQQRIEEFWGHIVAELESAINEFNRICPPDERVVFKSEGLSFTARKTKLSSPYSILSIRLDIETSRIQAFGRSSPFYEIKATADGLFVKGGNGMRIEKEALAQELLGEFFLTR